MDDQDGMTHISEILPGVIDSIVENARSSGLFSNEALTTIHCQATTRTDDEGRAIIELDESAASFQVLDELVRQLPLQDQVIVWRQLALRQLSPELLETSHQ